MWRTGCGPCSGRTATERFGEFVNLPFGAGIGGRFSTAEVRNRYRTNGPWRLCSMAW
jgi:hypothetical protein